ncbi:hypothetical protein AURDEDRAFT_111231 [Auricularia subglabra TFB-10046 SS5]|nr:hypothetical protein AURDEDRAFT_111231 [Auricularia subglabra TFB-10046 SS5]
MDGARSRSRPAHTYHGHKRYSFFPIDNPELVEIRARQRTFDGAYARTAIGSLAYSLVFLKLFDTRFYKIGLVFLVLAVMLAILAILRNRRSYHDFADQNRPVASENGTRVFGRAFLTAGWIVVAVTAVVGIVEVALLVLVLKITARPAERLGQNLMPTWS